MKEDFFIYDTKEYVIILCIHFIDCDKMNLI